MKLSTDWTKFTWAVDKFMVKLTFTQIVVVFNFIYLEPLKIVTKTQLQIKSTY